MNLWNEILSKNIKQIEPHYTCLLHMHSMNPIAVATNSVKFYNFKNVVQNPFLSPETRNNLIMAHCATQRTYFAFVKFLQKWRFRHSEIVVSHDISQCEQLCPTAPDTIILRHKRSLYLFKARDLAILIETAIGNAPEYFVDSLFPKNPYTNLQFTFAELYYIYDRIRALWYIKMPVLFHNWYLVGFNLHMFELMYEAQIRNYAIRNHVFNSPYLLLYYNVRYMLSEHPMARNLKIHQNFPRDVLVKIFRPFLYYKNMGLYSIGTLDTAQSYNYLFNEALKEFCKYNPKFGQKMRVNIFTNETEFNVEHLSWTQCALRISAEI